MADDELARLVETLALVREIERLVTAYLAAQQDWGSHHHEYSRRS